MNEVVVQGVRYVARKSTPGTCAGCAAFEPLKNDTTPLCLLLPACSPQTREDGRAIVWVNGGDK